jgi:hypothetical protein
MTNNETSITSENINKPKKAVAKKAAVKKEITEENISKEGKVLIVFESGAGYSTASGFRFSQRNKMGLLPTEEANLLLALDNFRLPSDEEKEMYYTNQED